jgi:protein required for attachment to host cells
VVVADKSAARFYEVERPADDWTLCGELADEKGHWHRRDFDSDRPGRVFDRAAGPGRRGASAHHATQGENDSKEHETQLFARNIGNKLHDAHAQGEFDKLAVFAPAEFLGILRAVMPADVKRCVVYEQPKDLVHTDLANLKAHLPAAL